VVNNPFLGEESSNWVRDTLIGELDLYRFALIQRDKYCEIHLRPKKGQVPLQGELKIRMDTLLLAIAFSHGQHAWPESYRLMFGSRTLVEMDTSAK